MAAGSFLVGRPPKAAHQTLLALARQRVARCTLNFAAQTVGAAPADQCFNSWRNRPGRALHSHQKLPAYAVECRTTSLPAAFKRCRMTPAGGVISFAGHTRRLQKLFQPKISLWDS